MKGGGKDLTGKGFSGGRQLNGSNPFKMLVPHPVRQLPRKVIRQEKRGGGFYEPKKGISRFDCR